MMRHALTLLVGIACAGLGGELFVRGVVGLANWAHISAGIVAATLAAFATSSPELTVAVNSALGGAPEISLGDALGSNVVNVALVLALAALIAPIPASRESVTRDYPVALAAPFVLAALAFDGTLSRSDGGLLLALFAGWLVAVVVHARRQRSAAGQVLGGRRAGPAMLSALTGLGLLIAAGHFVVSGSRTIASDLGIDIFVVGATLVALGTSVPELATAIISQLRRHSEVGLGTILGSNIFNCLFIVGVAAVIHPIHVEWQAVSVTVFAGIAATAIAFTRHGRHIGRGRGVLLLALFVWYVNVIL